MTARVSLLGTGTGLRTMNAFEIVKLLRRSLGTTSCITKWATYVYADRYMSRTIISLISNIIVQ